MQCIEGRQGGSQCRHDEATALAELRAPGGADHGNRDLATLPRLFIIESLDVEDEEGCKEGEILSRLLGMTGNDPIYRYVRTKVELIHFVEEFRRSRYRWLHVSVHGNLDLIALTLDHLTGVEFADIVAPALGREKRLFLSTCRAATEDLAREVFARGGARSVAGPVKKIRFGDSAVFWASFYHLMLKRERGRMLGRDVAEVMSLMGDAIGRRFRLMTPEADGSVKQRLLPAELTRSKKPR